MLSLWHCEHAGFCVEVFYALCKFFHPSIIHCQVQPEWTLTEWTQSVITPCCLITWMVFAQIYFLSKQSWQVVFFFSFFWVCAGPDHVTIFISPLPGIHIVSWSFGHLEPVLINTLPTLEDEGRDTHFVYYAYGQKPSKPWSFFINFYVRCCLNLSFFSPGFSLHPRKD